MNYKLLYIRLCERAKLRKEVKGYSEKHHMVPKCMGGGDSPGNIVTLTYREHYLAHRILALLFKTHRGIQYAFLCMLRDPKGKRKVTSKMYEAIKKAFAEFRREDIKNCYPGKTAKARAVSRQRMLTNNPIKLNPGKNHTAKPVEVTFKDGSTQYFEYGALAAKTLQIPYATFKLLIRETRGSDKHGIKCVNQIKGNP